MLEREFLDCLISQVTINRYLGEDEFGNNSYGDDELASVRQDSVRFSMSSERSIDRTAHDVISIYTLITNITPEPFKVRDRVTINGVVTYTSAVEVEYDEDGPHHVVITTTTEDES